MQTSDSSTSMFVPMLSHVLLLLVELRGNRAARDMKAELQRGEEIINIVNTWEIWLKNYVKIMNYLERWSETFWVRKTPITESTTEPFHREKRLSPVKSVIVFYGQYHLVK